MLLVACVCVWHCSRQGPQTAQRTSFRKVFRRLSAWVLLAVCCGLAGVPGSVDLARHVREGLPRLRQPHGEYCVTNEYR